MSDAEAVVMAMAAVLSTVIATLAFIGRVRAGDMKTIERLTRRIEALEAEGRARDRLAWAVMEMLATAGVDITIHDHQGEA